MISGEIKKKLMVASLVWKLPSELHEFQAEAVKELGYRHQFIFYNEAIPRDADIILIQGPYGPLSSFIRKFTDLTPQERPVLVYWFQQSLNMLHPEWGRRKLAKIFSNLHHDHRESGLLVRAIDRLWPGMLKSRGVRLGFLGDIFWLHQHGLLDNLVLSSTVYADYLARCGIPSMVVPRGYHPGFGKNLKLERDIAAVWMGKLRTKRRSRAVYWLKDELRKRGQIMHVYDGQENKFIYGKKRMEILNRAWFVLNVFFSGLTDELSIRYFVAAANGAVMLSEPSLNDYPFVPGEHFVQCPVKAMPDTILYYLEHKQEWDGISRNMERLVQREITLERSVELILKQAETQLISRR